MLLDSVFREGIVPWIEIKIVLALSPPSVFLGLVVVFTSPLFSIFILLFLGIYTILQFFFIWYKGKNLIQYPNLFFSYFLLGCFLFYSILYPPYLIILLATITIDYHLGKRIDSSHQRQNPQKAKFFLTLSIVYNLGTLGFWKYIDFLIINVIKINQILSWEALDFLKPLGIALPLGISFFTFQSMSYTIDIYRKVISPASSWREYAFYISFFPQLVAGPIVKAKDFLPQIQSPIVMSQIPIVSAMGWICLGIIKKTLIADRLAGFLDFVFQNPAQYSSFSLLVALLGYGIQIYCDFSGYSDIAIGLALLFGFRLPLNFSMPYLATSFSDFWRRWHISLSSWLRDYLYIPLGGNQISAGITYRNLFIVMLLGGLWHGANWNFVIWGGLHGIFLALERVLFKIRENKSFFLDTFFKIKTTSNAENSASSKYFSVIFSFIYRVGVVGIVLCLWIFFRCGTVDIAFDFLGKLWESPFSKQNGWNLGYTQERNFFIILAVVVFGHLGGKMGLHPKNWESIPFQPIFHSFVFALALIAFVLFSVPGKPFIYFVF